MLGIVFVILMKPTCTAHPTSPGAKANCMIISPPWPPTRTAINNAAKKVITIQIMANIIDALTFNLTGPQR